MGTLRVRTLILEKSGFKCNEFVAEVNERGTEAAAATAVLMSTTSLTSNPIDFIANRPFLFAIRDKQSGLIIFLGRVAKL